MNLVQYEGQFCKGMKHGKGKEYVFEKSTSEGKKNIGRLVYEGQYENNLKHGMGKMYKPQGDYIEGMFVNGNREGEFKKYDKKGNYVKTHHY